MEKRRELIRRDKLFLQERVKQANVSKQTKAYMLAAEARAVSQEAR